MFLNVSGARPLTSAPTGGARMGAIYSAAAMCRFCVRRTDGHDSGGVPPNRDPSESDRSGKMGSTAQDLLVLEFLVLGQ